MIFVFDGSVVQLWLAIVLGILSFIALGSVLTCFYLIRQLRLLILVDERMERSCNEHMFTLIDEFLRGER